jgi:hypothetical protein
VAFGLRKRRPRRPGAETPEPAAEDVAASGARQSESAPADGAPVAATSADEASGVRHDERPPSLSDRMHLLLRLVSENDEASIQELVLGISRRHRMLAPLAFALGAFALLFNGVKLLVSNWRLMVVEILPAMWIWLAMYDLKAHVLHGRSLNVLRGPILIPIGLAIIALTFGSYFLNAVFAFAISRPGRPEVRPAVAQARSNLKPIVAFGVVIGAMLALATTFVTRYGRPWFSLSLGAVVGIMMLTYVAVPARLIGAKPTTSKRDKLTATAVGGAIGATVCTPPYVLGRIGILMLGSKPLLIPGIILLAIGASLQAGATGAVRAVKMSAKLRSLDDDAAPSDGAEAELPESPRGPPAEAGSSRLGMSDASSEG